MRGEHVLNPTAVQDKQHLTQRSRLSQMLNETMTALFDLLPDAAAEFLALSVIRQDLRRAVFCFDNSHYFAVCEQSSSAQEKASCPSCYSATRQIKSRDLVPHWDHPLLHEALGKSSVMRLIFLEAGALLSTINPTRNRG